MERISVPDAIERLLGVVGMLRHSFPQKRFTLDGRLVGDLGEILVSQVYELTLHEGIQKHHDAMTPDGRQVQIKSTMQKSLTFPADHIPDYYLGIKINEDGTFEEIFNGPGHIAYEGVRNRKPTKYNLYSISIPTLRVLDQQVKPVDRIARLR